VHVAIRVDADQDIGIGHLVRCLTLADTLHASGSNVTLLCRSLPSGWAATVRERGHVLKEQPDSQPFEQMADAEWTRTQMVGRVWDWVVVDHYGLSAVWEQRVGRLGRRLLVIDDLADRVHACDLLLDQNYLPGRDGAYAALVPGTCRLLLGPLFALVHPEYAEHRMRLRPRPTEIQRALIFFGGMDTLRLTERALEALARPGCADLDVDVVCVAHSERVKALEATGCLRGRTRVYGRRGHLADLMAVADVAFGAGGSTTWERLCLGVPALTVTVAANQEHVAQALAADGLIVLLGSADEVTTERMAEAMRELRRGRGWPDVARGMTVCDGTGATRVVETMTSFVGLDASA
jgi:UDP-2,4-diacetamido-2,4,6-trideoxy-beta-L-altropyranose hydrolase